MPTGLFLCLIFAERHEAVGYHTDLKTVMISEFTSDLEHEFGQNVRDRLSDHSNQLYPKGVSFGRLFTEVGELPGRKCW